MVQLKKDRIKAIDIFNRTLKGESTESELSFTNGRICDFKNEPLKDKDGEIIGMFGTGRDITERKKMEKELLKTSKIESLGIFAGGIAHDFNNLLTVILGNMSMVKLKTGENTPEYKWLSNAELASIRARDLTTQILTFSKISKFPL